MDCASYPGERNVLHQQVSTVKQRRAPASALRLKCISKRRTFVSGDIRNEKDHEQDPLGSTEDLVSQEVPPGVDRRAFLIRSALISATAVLTGHAVSAQDRANRLMTGPPPIPPLSPTLDVVKKSYAPVMTTLDEFYKVGPGPSSSHTIGPMRITYDFYQRCTKLPTDKLSRATALKVELFGSLSATGKGHGTDRASLAGLIGKEPASIDPAFLDRRMHQGAKHSPDCSRPYRLGQ
jgi:L-serine dehydratase